MSWLVAALTLAGHVLIANCGQAADRDRPVRIGALTDSWGPTPAIVGLRDGLKELGYRENTDFVIGVRFTQGDTSALADAARELVQQGADILFPGGRDELRAAKKATAKLPIVFAGGDDPVKFGLIQSFAKPGGNITGVSNLDLELSPKRLEIFRSIVTGMKRVLFPYNSAVEFNISEAKSYRETARKLGMTLVEKAVESEEEARQVVLKVHDYDVQGILAPTGVSLNIPGLIQQATLKQRIATMFRLSFFVEDGGLASYSPDDYESGRRSARLVEKILKGATPGEIPVEVNTKIELVINVKVAKALGLEIPPEVLFRADRLIQ